MAPDCQVRKLHIRAQEQSFVPRLTYVLEEALRTASFTGVPANGVVYVRSLDLGRHGPSVSSRALARKIDDLFRAARPVMITETRPEQPAASVVWFPDELSPYRLLIKLLAANQRPLSWYWPTAVQGWHSQLGGWESCHLVLTGVSAQKTGIKGLGLVLAPLLDAGRLHDLFDRIGRRGTARLLGNLGLKQALDFQCAPAPLEKGAGRKEKETAAAVLAITAAERASLAAAVRRWSVFDPRTMLLSYLILDRLGKEPHPVQVGRLLATLASAASDRRTIPNPIVQSGNGAAAATGNTALRPGKQPSDDLKEKMARAETAPPGEDQERRGLGGRDSRLENEAIEGETRKTTETAVRSERQADAPARDRQPQQAKERRAVSSGKHLTEAWPLFGGFAGRLSQNAGLVFLVPLLKRLGIEALLATSPEYERSALPKRILWRCARLLHILPDDPVLLLLGKEPEESFRPSAFTAPPHWRRLFPSSGKLHLHLGRVPGQPGRRLLLDEKERLILGVWQADNRKHIARWLEAAQKPMPAATPQSWSLKRLEDNFLLAMSRYVRRYAAMGLASLVRRPAAIACTRTHLDVTIPFRQLDVRVRMAGLDIDPGWVPWLGRVIQFHYVGEER